MSALRNSPNRVLRQISGFIFIFFQFKDSLAARVSVQGYAYIANHTGFLNASPFRASTSSVIVALMRKDWKTFGRRPPPNNCLTSSSWPYDRMRSASSMMRDSRELKDRVYDEWGWIKLSMALSGKTYLGLEKRNYLGWGRDDDVRVL